MRLASMCQSGAYVSKDMDGNIGVSLKVPLHVGQQLANTERTICGKLAGRRADSFLS